MPKNSTGTIAIYTDVGAYTATSTAGGQHTFSPEDTEVRFRNIPANVNGVGLLLFLPGEPSDGDEYTFSDRDGSCSPGHVIVVKPDPNGTATIEGESGPLDPDEFFAPFAGCTYTFDAPANVWTADLSANPAAAAPTPARAWAPSVEIQTFTHNPQVVASVTVTPTVTGKFRCLVMGAMTTSTAGGDNNVTPGISHGSGNPAPDYEQGSATPGTLIEKGNVGTVAMVVDLDQLATPVVFPLGTPVQINATIRQTGSAGHIIANGITLEVQEVS
jgi:hypothetical protein